MKTTKWIGRTAFGLLMAALLGGIGYVVYLAFDDEGARAEGRRIYLKERVRRENARAEVKAQAIATVLAHGKKASSETRQAANALIESKVAKMGLRGSARMFAQARLRRYWRLQGENAAPGFSDRKFTKDELELLSAADEAISEKDLETAQLVAAAALESEDPRVRLKAVETLTEFGEAGLAELSDFLLDPHPDVANLAADRFEIGLQEIENEKEQVTMAKLGLLTINDEDQLRSLAGTLTMAVDKFEVLEALVEVIVDGTETQSAIAREYYESETGEEWQGVDAANRWLQENYEPPEPEESEEAEPPAEEEFQEEEGSY